jgi:hypothetical protein
MLFGRKREAQNPEVGNDVMTADEETLGTVAVVNYEFIEVEGGPMDHRQTWRVPRSAIKRIDGQTIHLSSSRAQVAAKGWAHTVETSETAPSV